VAGARGKVDVVHLHWLEYIVRTHGRAFERLASTHVQVARYVVALRRLRSSGIRTVWTVHNRRPHESPYPWLDGPLVRRTAAEVDGFIFHSLRAAQDLASDLRRTLRAWIAPHPHYQGLYPYDHRPRAVQRAAYGLNEASFVFLMFGQARSYKRIPEAVAAFRRLPDEDARLVVAGSPIDERLARAVREAANGDERVTLLLRYIPDEQVSTLFGISDALVLNYREVFTSGALLLALSYGVPVVAPLEGSARDVAPPLALETFDGSCDLTRALSAMRRGDPDGRRAAALRAVEPYTYDALAAEVISAYRGEGGRTVLPEGP
jgi:glycosyltransferase involved in cell wall biosynthesis